MSDTFRAAFYGRVSTEDRQSPDDSIAWQRAAAQALIEAHGGKIVAEYLDVGVSRSLPWSRRLEATRLLADCGHHDRRFEAVVIGEPQRAFSGTQYGLTAPLLWHHGVELWVPEVGGRVDPDSEAHDLVMSLFGGLSKAERARIQRRVRAAMTTMARTGGRYLGGRPPYGYRLVSTVAHPNAEKARLGATLNRLEADPQTAPVVQRIFSKRLAGTGYTAIARGLNGDGIPSPAAYDRARNTHRDPRGWADSAVRAILANPRYTGHEVWARQRRDYELLDPSAPADGHVRRMRWNPAAEWIWSPELTHEPLISRDKWEAAQAPVKTGRRAPKAAARTYLLRGRVHCGVCGRKMHGETRAAKHRPRVYYRCPVRGQYPGAAADHTGDVFVPEAPLLTSLDGWIAELFTPERAEETARELVEAAQATDAGSAVAVTQERLANARRKLVQYRTALDDGADSSTVSSWITQAAAEERAAQAELNTIKQASPPTLTVDEVMSAVTALGGLVSVLEGAESTERAELYAALGVEITYQPDPRTAVLAVEPQALGQARVGGGTWRSAPRGAIESDRRSRGVDRPETCAFREVASWAVGSERSVRSYEPFTDEFLQRLATLAARYHETFARLHPEWAQKRLAACLVQGAARHRVHGDRGVKDIDVYTFYAKPENRNAGHFPWNRNVVFKDFGTSTLGRQLYTSEDWADDDLAAKIPMFETFVGRRVDLMGRSIAAHVDGPREAVRTWLERGARKKRTRPKQNMSSDWHLARAPVVCIDPDCGELWWPGPDVDDAGLEKGAYS